MLIQGPLCLNWMRRKWGILPRLENAEISAVNPPAPARIGLWVGQYVHVAGRPEWVFVKVHTHGCVQENARVLLGRRSQKSEVRDQRIDHAGLMREAHEHLQEKYNGGRNWALHYVTAREMYNIARAAEDGLEGDPGAYRDYVIAPPGRKRDS